MSCQNPIRVLHVTNVGPENYYLNNLCDYTDPSQVEYLAVTLGESSGFLESLRQRGVTGYALHCGTRMQYPKAAWLLRQIIRREQIDIVHAHLFEPTLLSVIVAGLCGRKLVVTRHHSDAVHRVPRRLKRNLYLNLEGWINHRASHIIAPSRRVREVLTEMEYVPPEKISLIPYGQTTDRFDSVTDSEISRVQDELGMKDQLSFVCVSRLHPEKGHRYLFDAWARLKQTGLAGRLFLVGTGAERNALEQLADQMDFGHTIRFLGWRDDALAIIAAADVVVHPSLHEALPSAVIEALMLRRPLVATDVSGVRDIVGNNDFGMVVPPADANALEAAIRQTIADPGAARTKAEQGRDAVLRYMDARRVALEYVTCYQKVMGNQQSAQNIFPLQEAG